MSAHTPGPWTVVAIDWAETGNARFEIEGIRRTGMADAHLIAAAPELLAACKDTLETYRGFLFNAYGKYDDDTTRALEAAIAKAEGRA